MPQTNHPTPAAFVESFTDVMVDLETLGTGPHALILSIGAVPFTLGSHEVIPENDERLFYHVIYPESAYRNGGMIDPDTVMWWLEQSFEARNALINPSVEPVSIHAALQEFVNWIAAYTNGEKKVRIWGNGAAFDNVILRSAFENAGIIPPWKFWNDRCYRTVKASNRGVPCERYGVHHHALWDAYTQTVHLLEMTKEG